MPDTRLRMSQSQFEVALAHVEPNHWATGERVLYHPAMTAVQGWNIFGSVGFRKLTNAQRVLLYWGDLIGQVSNGGIAQLHSNMPDVVARLPTALEALGWDELSIRFEVAQAAYIAPSATIADWRNRRALEDEFQRKRLLKAWRSGIETYDPLPIWLLRFWHNRLGGRFDRAKTLKAWRRHYRDKPEPDMLWVFAAQVEMPTRPVSPWEAVFNSWFCSDQTKFQSYREITRFLRDHKDELVETIDD
jgi:Domain of unknown function (DUF4375)